MLTEAKLNMKLIPTVTCLIAAMITTTAAPIPIDPGTPWTSGPSASTNFGASGGLGETGFGNPIAGDGGSGSSAVGVVGADSGGNMGSRFDDEPKAKPGSGSELAAHPMTEALPGEPLDELNRPVFVEDAEGGAQTSSPPPLAVEGGDGRGASVHCPRRRPPMMYPVSCAPTEEEGQVQMIPALEAGEIGLMSEDWCRQIIGLLYEAVEGSEDKPVLVGAIVGRHDTPSAGRDTTQLVYPEEMGLSPSSAIAWK